MNANLSDDAGPLLNPYLFIICCSCIHNHIESIFLLMHFYCDLIVFDLHEFREGEKISFSVHLLFLMRGPFVLDKRNTICVGVLKCITLCSVIAPSEYECIPSICGHSCKRLVRVSGPLMLAGTTESENDMKINGVRN